LNINNFKNKEMELQKLDSEKKYTSLYLVEQINLFRSQESERSVLLHKNLLVKIETEFFDEIAELKFQPSSYKDSSGKECKCYELNYEQSLQILMSESKVVRKGVIEVLKAQQKEIDKLKENSTPKTFAQALRLAAEQQELIEQQALQVDNLSTALDILVEWVSIIKVAKHNGIKETAFNWRALKKTSELMGFQIKKAQSPRFKFQNLYNINVFKACYPQYKYDLK
jgi:hypothetical protein